MILLVASHARTTLTIRSWLGDRLPLRKDEAMNLKELLDICRTDPPKCITIFEIGFDLDMRSRSGRYAMVMELAEYYPHIPVVFCSEEPDEAFYNYAKDRVKVFLSCTDGVDRNELFKVLEGILKGETPRVARPQFTIPPENTQNGEGWAAALARHTSRKQGLVNPSPMASSTAVSVQKEALDVPTSERSVPFQAEAHQVINTLQEQQRQQQHVQSQRHEEERVKNTPQDAAITYSKTEPEAQNVQVITRNANQEQRSGNGFASGLREGLRSILPGVASHAIVSKDERSPHSSDAVSQDAAMQPTMQRNSSFTFPHRDVIGVMALSRGAGATHSTVAIARYLARRGQTAVCAFDGSDDLKYSRLDSEGIFVHLPTVAERREVITQAYHSGFRFLVIDFGTPFELAGDGYVTDGILSRYKDAFEELYRCNRILCLYFSADWHIRKREFMESTMKIKNNVEYLSERERDINIDDLMGKLYPGLQPRQGLFRSRSM